MPLHYEEQPWNASDGTFWSLAGTAIAIFAGFTSGDALSKRHASNTASNILRRLNQLNQVAAIRLFDFLTIC